MFQTGFVEKMKLHILCPVTFFRKSAHLSDNVVICGGAREATDENNILRMRFAYWVRKIIRAHTFTQKYVILNAFPQQQWFCERASLLRYSKLPV
jgi:hypothetical protein